MAYHSRLDYQRRWNRRQRIYNISMLAGSAVLWTAIWWVILTRL